MEKVDLTYLKSMSADSNELLLEMIDIFKSQVPEFVEEFNRHLNNKEWIALGQISHKAKSSAAIVGLNILAEDLKVLELDTKDAKNVSAYADRVEHINATFIDAVVQLDKIVTTL